MKTVKTFALAIILSIGIQLSSPSTVTAQCAMCSLTAQNATENGNQQGNGLNSAILYLLAMPYLAAVGIGYLWYKKYKPKKKARISDEPISLN
jgi:hypothetical protein